MAHGQGGAEIGFGCGPTLTCNHEAPIAAIPSIAHTLLGKHNSSHAEYIDTYVAHTLRGTGFDASEDGTGRGTPPVPVAFAIQAGALRTNPDSGPAGIGVQQDHAYTLEARAEVQCVAYPARTSGTQCASAEDLAPALGALNPTAIAFSCKDYGADAIEKSAKTERAAFEAAVNCAVRYS